MTGAMREETVCSPAAYICPAPLFRVGACETALFSLLLSASFLPPELVSAVMLGALLLLLFDPFPETGRRACPGIARFLLLLFVGLSGASGSAVRDVAKDAWYVGNAAMTLWVAYLAAKKLDDIRALLRTFLAAAAVASLVHLCRFALDPALLVQPVVDIRVQVGAGYLLSAIGTGILLADHRYRLGLLPGTLVTVSAHSLFLSSVALSFSRTLWVAVLTFLSVLLVLAYARLVIPVAIVAAAVFIVVAASPLTDEAAETGANSTFAEKVINSLQEVRVSDYEDESAIHRNWRGFENYRALATYTDGGGWQYLFGKGFGTGVDLGVTMVLMDKEFDSVPVLHNGYLYLLVKTGVVGMAAYLSYLFISFRRGALLLRVEAPPARACGYLVLALALFMLQSTFVIAGMFNKGWVFPATMFLGMLIGHGEPVLHAQHGATATANHPPLSS